MKRLFSILLLCLVAAPAWAADTKVSADTNLPTLASGDEFYCVDDPGGTPLSRACTIDVIQTFVLQGEAATATALAANGANCSAGQAPLGVDASGAVESCFTPLQNVAEDTTPQLGGQLDVNANAIGDGTLELLKFVETGSAVNEVTITNAATGNAPEISATGDDTNIDLKLSGKGTGGVQLGAPSDPADSGAVRLDNNTTICWEASPAGTDVCITADASEIVQISGGTLDGGDLGTNTVTSSKIASEVRSMYWPAAGISSDGTQCANPAEATINSGPKQYTIICTDNDASVMYGNTIMPDSWDEGNLTFELAYVQTAVDTSALEWDVYVQCRGEAETVNNTWETAVNVIDAAVTGSNAVDHTTSGNVTCAGDAGGDQLFWKIELDAAGTTTAMATVHFLGMKMEYTTNVGD